jgi:O-methyltransferase
MPTFTVTDSLRGVFNAKSMKSITARMRPFTNRLRNRSCEPIRQLLMGWDIQPVRMGKILEYVAALRYAVGNAQGFDLPEDPDRDLFLARLLGTTVPEGIYITNFLHLSLCSPGDVCEFGVAQGATSALLANEIKRKGRALWLYDSFDGLPESTSEDELPPASIKHAMATPERLVHARLRQPPLCFENYHVVKGYFKNLAGTPGPENISFAYVDFDLFAPILDALDFVHPRLTGNGAIIVDDYGDGSWAGARKAVQQFLSVHSREYSLLLPPEPYGNFCVLTRISPTVRI